MKKIIHNGTLIIDGSSRIENGYLITEDGKIQEVGRGPAPECDNAEFIDAQGNYILPGFIDIHIHGAMGKDLIEGTQKSVDAVATNVIKDGCTSFMASLTVLSHEEMLHTLDGFSKVEAVENGAHFLGVHEEGPYLSEKYNALMDLRYLRDPSISEMKEMIEHSGNRIKIMTVAPERNGMEEFITYLKDCGITVMIGHTDAKPEDVHMAVKAGAKGFTHLYNAMSQHLHREPGCVTGAMIETDSYAELICDGFHVNKNVVIATYKIFTPKRLVLITDAMLGKGMPDGDYTFSGLSCYKEGKHVRVKETGRIAGSAFGMNDAVACIREFCQASMNDIVQMACVNPSILANVSDQKGTLTVGKDADIIIMDNENQIKTVFVSGKEVY
ncbi:MAG: N-acetylglucosamine-6-phosphate deacetylase [Lachnospiraceae bacterium]|nr:N-acetylglucosamine-6-phosphate deacetylase [Lachnospiraceae bacterium]